MKPVAAALLRRRRRMWTLLGGLALGCALRPQAATPAREATAVKAPSQRMTARTTVDHLYVEPARDASATESPTATARNAMLSHPLDGKSDDEIERMLLDTPEALGPMSVGSPSSGVLLNAVQLPEDARWERVDPGNAWATQETIDYLRTAAARVWSQFPDAPKLHVGHISAKNGGFLEPHLSHQTGRDVDISYFYREGGRWYARGTRNNLALDLTWTFVRAIIAETDVEMILIDQSIQALLKQHARDIGEDPTWLDSVFRGGSGEPAIVRHARGHSTHMHVRFFSPVAQETARRAYPFLVKHELVKSPVYFVNHRARRGETLGKLARRYGTTVEAIQQANRLRSTKIIAKKTYKIPSSGPVARPTQPLSIPPRRVPPEPRENPRSAHKGDRARPASGR